MAGGYGNIKPEDGKQFSSEYQPDKTIWKEEVCIKFCNDLIEWMNEDEENMFYKEFILKEANPEDYGTDKIPHDIISTIYNKKYTSCVKLINKAKELQKMMLIKNGVLDRLNASMTKFVLINDHGMVSEKNIQDLTNSDGSMSPKLTEAEKNELIKQIKNGLDELKEY